MKTLPADVTDRLRPLFLDPCKPLATCAVDCEGNPAQSHLQCHFGGWELVRFLGIASPAFIVGCIEVARVSAWQLNVWPGALPSGASGHSGLIQKGS